MTIGFPRALIYWKEPGVQFWRTFFEELGLEVIISPLTNKEIASQGTKVSDSDNCFASKVFFGHLMWLEKKVDFIFIPRLIKDEFGLEHCPKFFALPDIAALLVKTSIISPWIDLKKKSFQNIVFKTGKKFCNNSEKIRQAVKKGEQEMKKEKEKRIQSFQQKINSDKKKIVLISHPYNLYDEYVNLGIRQKLDGLGIESIFIDEVSVKNTQIQDLNLKKTGRSNGRNFESPNWHWKFCQEIMDQVREIIKLNAQKMSGGLAGAIEISSFQCGCDAVLKEFVEKEFKQGKIPFLYLLIDEHSAEAGIQTRLEAFVDTIKL